MIEPEPVSDDFQTSSDSTSKSDLLNEVLESIGKDCRERSVEYLERCTSEQEGE